MSFRVFRRTTIAAAAVLGLVASSFTFAQSPQPGNNPQQGSSSSAASSVPSVAPQEKAPSLVDPGGPAISLVSSEPVFLMAAALNACGYDEGLDQSSPVRKRVRDELNDAFARSEEARTVRDQLCLFIAQHRMTGTARDISQYISLSLYLTPPPEVETSAELAEMPPDSTQVAEVVPLLRKFVSAVDLHGIWLTVHRSYDEEAAQLHDPLYKAIQATNLYLKMPFDSYSGRRFIVVMEPMLSPALVNARVYGPDYVVVVSPSDGKIRLDDVRHTYLHYLIEPLLYSRSNAIDRMQPILKVVRDAPLDFMYRSEAVPLVVECLIKAIEARTMDTGVPIYKIPAGIERSELPRYERERQASMQKAEGVRLAAVHHDMTQGFVLTQYFYDQMVQFEKDPASLRDNIGEMVYSMDIDQQVHRAREINFDTQADGDVLQRTRRQRPQGLDLAETKLQAGDIQGAAALARQALANPTGGTQAAADTARANFILARVAIMTGHPDEAISRFQTTLATSKEARLLAWSHIYLGRMLDLDCKRDQAVSEYKLALETRDGQQDTRLAAERGVKSAYAVQGHSCEEDDADDQPNPAPSGGAQPALPKNSTAPRQP